MPNQVVGTPSNLSCAAAGLTTICTLRRPGVASGSSVDAEGAGATATGPTGAVGPSAVLEGNADGSGVALVSGSGASAL